MCGVSGGCSAAFPRVGPHDAVVYPVSSDVTFLRCARPASPLCFSSFCLFLNEQRICLSYTCIMICLLKSNDILKGYFIKRYDKNYQKDKQDMTS